MNNESIYEHVGTDRGVKCWHSNGCRGGRLQCKEFNACYYAQGRPAPAPVKDRIELEPGWEPLDARSVDYKQMLGSSCKPADLNAQIRFVSRVNDVLDCLLYKSWFIQAYCDYGAGAYLQVTFTAPDWSKARGRYANPSVQQTGRKWRLSEHMTRSEIVQTAFLAVLTAEEHEAREQFLYKGRAIFGPHFDVENLHDASGRLGFEDVRPEPTPAVYARDPAAVFHVARWLFVDPGMS